MMMARRVGFATVRSDFVSISFQVGCETAARFMYWASIVCGTLSS